MRQILKVASILLLAAGAWAAPPKMAESRYLVTRQGTFIVVGGEGVKYDLQFGVRQPFAAPVHVTVDFENPEDTASPLFVEMELPAGQAQFDVQSPPMKAVRNREEYLVKVWIYEDALRRKLIGTHEQVMQLKLPRQLLKLLNVRLL
jgi:hypothetical protein